MTQIYKLVVGKGQPYRWLQLPEDERKSLWDKVNKAFEEVGGKRTMICDSSWSSEEYPGFFIEIFPDIEALQKYSAYLNKINFLQYFDTITVVGTETQLGA
jgi:hypothetical protein